jgi:pilus assembly protein CpaE
MTEQQVTVLVVDDQRPFRVAAAAVLRRTPGFVLVGEAASGEEALDQVAALEPDLVLMDINMPGMGGVEAARQVRATAPGTVVFLCSTYERADLPPAAAASGAVAYVHKEELRPDLLARLWAGAAPSTPAV